MKNKGMIINTCFAIFCAFLLAKTTFAEPNNIGQLITEIKHYHDSGAYQHELNLAIDKAKQYILNRAQTSQNEKLAIVLDIDETSLSNYSSMEARHFMPDHKKIHEDILAARGAPILPTLSLYREALKHHVAVFFVTGRNPSERSATIKNLKQAGFNKWNGLYVRTNHYKNKSIIPFKSSIRAEIIRQGYKIIASIGDQHSDLKGGYAEKTFKLPNPYYYLP